MMICVCVLREGQKFLLTSRKTPLQFVKFAGRPQSICFPCWTERLARGPCSPVRHQTLLRKKTRAYWGRRQSRWLRTAGGFAVCDFSARFATICGQRSYQNQIRDQHNSKRIIFLRVALKLQRSALTGSMLHRSDWTDVVGALDHEELWQYNLCVRLHCGCDGSWNWYC
jgi:hypothetical protein